MAPGRGLRGIASPASRSGELCSLPSLGGALFLESDCPGAGEHRWMDNTGSCIRSVVSPQLRSVSSFEALFPALTPHPWMGHLKTPSPEPGAAQDGQALLEIIPQCLPGSLLNSHHSFPHSATL